MRMEQSGDDVLLWIKAVSGASRSVVAGGIGDRLKVRVSAPAEGGKANQAICELLAEHLSLKLRQISIHAGHASAEKIIRIHGVQMTLVADALRSKHE